MPDWAVAIAQPQQLDKVVEQIAAYPFQYFFPRIKRTIRRRGRRVHLLDPLLFNYLPVFLSDGWEVIFDMRGVRDVIGPVNTEELLKLKAKCDADGFYFLPHQHRFKVGQAVTPTEGPFEHLVGTYEKRLANEREVALFDLLGGKRPVDFDAGNLVAA